MATTKRRRDEIVAVIERKPLPDRRPRVVATKSFVHRGNTVEVGSIWLADHDVVASAPGAFADVREDA